MALIPYRQNSSPASILDEIFRMPDLWEDTRSSVRGIAADVYETPEAIVVETATPGINPDDINISVSGDTLTISGESKREEVKDDTRQYYQKQIRYGNFAQSVTLPSTVQSDKAEASFNNGILTVTMPKSEQAKPKKIQVKIGSGK